MPNTNVRVHMPKALNDAAEKEFNRKREKGNAIGNHHATRLDKASSRGGLGARVAFIRRSHIHLS